MLQDNTALERTQTEIIAPGQTEFLPEKSIPDDRSLREDYEKLRITYELQRDIGSDINIEVVLDRILDRTFEFLNYDSGVILLVNKEGNLKPRTYRHLKRDSKLILSSTLIRYVVKEKKGVISSDILADDRFNVAESIMISGIRSSIAVPILHREEILGVIMIQSSRRINAFGEKDLHLLMNIANHTAQYIKNSLLHEELMLSFESAIKTFSAMVDARHPLTAGHSERVAEISVMIAKEMGLDSKRIEALRLAALLHDIGKIGIPDQLLLKDGPLDPSEREEMNRHPLKTRRILENFHFPRFLRRVPEMASLHHERVDGKGYPGGVPGDHLPLEAKIMAVADVFDALVSPRDYPKYDAQGKAVKCDRMSVSKALNVLVKESDHHFDTEVVETLTRCLAQAAVHSQGPDFDFEDMEGLGKVHPSTVL